MEIGAEVVRPVRLFYSYSHRDEEFRSALETHLSVLRRSGLLAEWHDGMIGAGGDWRGEIDRHLASADIVLLLVSADFIASDFCWSEEMTKALQRHERGEARVIPVILRPCRWRSTPLTKLHAVPRHGKPVTDWLNQDTAFDDVAAAIQRIIEDLQQERLRVAEEVTRRAEEERLQAEAKAAREAEEQRRYAEVEAKRRNEEERRQRAQAKMQANREEKEEHLRAEAKAAREAEEQRRYAEVEAKRRNEEERQRRAHVKMQANQEAEEERLRAEARAAREAQEQRRYAEVEAIRRDEKERQRRERQKMEASQLPAQPKRQWRGGSLRHWLAGGALVTFVATVVGIVLVNQEVGKHAPAVTDEPSTPAPIPTPAVTDEPSTPARIPTPAVTDEPSTPAPIPTPATRKPAPKPGETFADCETCPEMVVIPGGTFLMGSSASEQGRDNDEGPKRQVTIEPFAIGKYEVTFGQWDACVAANDCNGHRPSDNGWGRDSRPVMNVSWQDAQAYVDWLTQKTNERYRLPTEAEWEYAARAGTTTPFSFGATITTQQANFNGNNYGGGSNGEYRRQTVPVGSLPSNSWGLHQMHGNVWEWVEDCYHNSYQGAPQDGSAWTSGQCSTRVLRGGSWDSGLTDLRSASRNFSEPHVRVYYFGFRVARDLD